MTEPLNIYMIGICGVAMGTLAGMLKTAGHNVAGSDSNVYPPMSTKLNDWGIKINNGYNPENIISPDLVIIGNAISRGNPEAEYVLNRRFPYTSMAGALYDFFLKDREIISICGTHGKTTTTALLSHILTTAGEDPSFLIGGVSKNYDSNFRLGRGRQFIIEGDEYDSAFFEKIPKFIIYRPHHIVITSLEFDHADIYSNIDEIKLWFRRLVNIIPSEGNIVLSGEYPVLNEITEKSLSRCSVFGKNSAGFRYELLKYSDMSELRITSKEYGSINLKSTLFGDFNFANIAGAVSMALLLGINKTDIQKAVETFSGVKRRQELIYENSSIKIYEDFAHHPTAIKSVLMEMKKRYPESVLWAIYEPRSATSRRNHLQNELPSSFEDADSILIKRPYNLDSIPVSERIDIEEVLGSLKKIGKSARLFDSVDDIISHVFANINLKEKNIITIMSNGGFDGIYRKIIEKAKSTAL